MARLKRNWTGIRIPMAMAELIDSYVNQESSKRLGIFSRNDFVIRVLNMWFANYEKEFKMFTSLPSSSPQPASSTTVKIEPPPPITVTPEGYASMPTPEPIKKILIKGEKRSSYILIDTTPVFQAPTAQEKNKELDIIIKNVQERLKQLNDMKKAIKRKQISWKDQDKQEALLLEKGWEHE
jgi:hypothetical protein